MGWSATGLQVGKISRVGQLVEIDDAMIFAERKHMADEIRTDKARPTGDEYFHEADSRRVPTLRCGPDGLFAPVSATKLFARSKDSNVPASVHHPSRTS